MRFGVISVFVLVKSANLSVGGSQYKRGFWKCYYPLKFFNLNFVPYIFVEYNRVPTLFLNLWVFSGISK